MVSVGQFVRVTVSGIAPRSYAGLGEPPNANELRDAITTVLFSDGLNPRSVDVTGGGGALIGPIPVPFQDPKPYTATITVVAGNSFASPDDLGAIVAHDVGVAVGAYPSTVGSASIVGAPIPETPSPSDGSLPSWLTNFASGFQSDVQLVTLGLVALAALALILLTPELKKSFSL